MNLNQIVNAVVSTNSRGVTQRGFGTPMILGVHTNTQETVKSYDAGSILSDLVTDGFTAYDPIYVTANSIVANTPRPNTIKIGKLVTAFSQAFDITVADNVVEDKVYSFTLRSPAGVDTEISYTALVTDDHEDVATALAALITAVSGITASATLEVISCSADNNNEMWRCLDINPQDLQYNDTTVDSNLATELAANDIIDSDYYGLVLADPNSEPRMLALAAHIETKEKILGAVTHDYDPLDSTSVDDIAYDLKAAEYNRTYCAYSSDQSKQLAAGWMGSRFPFNPGSQTWAYKAPSGVTVENSQELNANFTASLRGKNANYYYPIQGLNGMINGKMASGEWIDVIRGRDHFVQRCRERIWQIFANTPKVPFTDAGIETIVNALRAQVAESTAFGYLDSEREAVYSAPFASEVSAASKAARTLPNVSVTVYLAGAIHIVDPLTVIIEL